ncbi:hypothetical protein [Lysinibacillus pakistanensis]|uniref:hypothetical protein n=1 Tax=Lysinibacillus pakistanensis TaxID=759811 RepID=UPI003D27BB7F
MCRIFGFNYNFETALFQATSIADERVGTSRINENKINRLTFSAYKGLSKFPIAFFTLIPHQ